MIDRARQLVTQTTHVEVFSGAGMSADSGLATFRDAQTGVWSHVDPQAMASIDAWARDPEPMWAWYLWRHNLVKQAQPHAGHKALAQAAATLAKEGRKLTVTTQNIDNLHERAGSSDVVHLHGSLFEFRCSICARPWHGEVPTLSEPVERLTPPECPLCHNLVRPSVVWFGEGLPSPAWEKAQERMVEADVVIIVGTSGVVFPAASLPIMAAQLGTPTIEVSPARTELTELATVFCEGTAAEVLPQILNRSVF